MPKVKDIKKIQKEIIGEGTIEEIYKQDFQAPLKISKSSGSLKTAILVIFFSVIGGFLGGVASNGYVSQDLTAITQINTNNTPEVIDLEFLLSKEDQEYSKVLSQLRSQVVGFYKKRTSEEILGSLYLEKDFLGSGVIVTSDGWLLTHKQVVGNEDYVIITADKKALEPLKEVVDPLTNLVLVQVSASDLAPVKFADLNYLQVTNPILAVRYSAQNHGSDIIKTSVQRFSYHDQVKANDFLLSTEKIDHYLKITNDFDLVYNGGILFNGNNEVVGLMFESGRAEIRLAIPGYYLKSAVSNFLSSSAEVIRSQLGVNYLDLSESLGLAENITEGRVKGAVLLGNLDLNILAVAEGSPAAEAGLKAGDIIIKVNNEEVDEKNSLTKLIQDYTPGQELTLTFIRAGEEQEVKVVLGEM